MPTLAEVIAEAAQARAAIDSYALPETLLSRLPSDDVRSQWGRLLDSVRANVHEGFAILDTIVASGDAERADAMLGAIEHRWAAWLRQVRNARHDRLQVPRTMTERASSALTEYGEGVVHLMEHLPDLPSPSDVGRGIAVAVVAAVAAAVLLRR